LARGMRCETSTPRINGLIERLILSIDGTRFKPVSSAEPALWMA
jgi:hypothetical protein